MDSPVPGINKWIAGIRNRMENDPGRLDLDDHILCNGFLFLDEYLEDILTGARTEPIIELTKTPGRRKDLSKKVRSAATMKMFTFELGSPSRGATAFAKSPDMKRASTSLQSALLEASKENRPPDLADPTNRVYSPHRSEPRSPFGHAIQSKEQNVQDAKTTETIPRVTSEHHSENSARSLLTSQSVEQLSGPLDNIVYAPQESAERPVLELSIIPEGDEVEVSHASLLSRLNAPIMRDKEISDTVPKDPANSPMGNFAMPDESNDDDEIQAFQTPYDRSFNESEPTSTASSFPIDPYARDYETHELRYMVGSEQPSESVPTLQSPPSPILARKASVPVFPSLPGPSPLRKSTHELSGTGQSASNTRSSIIIGNGTRTSWLNKTRDVTAKLSVVSGVKRKSVDLPGEPSSMTTNDGYVRPTKVAKTSTEESLTNSEESYNKFSIQPFRAVAHDKAREPPLVQAVPVVDADSNSEGMMSILKRTVAGLGARVGKSTGRSLGGAAATAAAAEAKAAAEARLAQREAKGDGNQQGRLSVSDLIGVYNNGKGNDKGSESIVQHFDIPTLDGASAPKASISTTPPDSPPAMSNSPLITSTTPAGIKHTIPKFTVQRPTPLVPSFTPPDSQPSTQSTYVSSIFDDHSAWLPSSQLTELTASQGFSQPEGESKDFLVTISQFPKEADRPNNQPFAEDYSRAKMIQESEPVTAPHVVVVEGSRQVPGAFELEDECLILSDDGLHGVENGQETNGAMGTSTSSLPVDTDVKKIKEGSSQPSPQLGLVAQASGLLSKVMGTSVVGAGSALGASKRGKAEPVKSIQLAAAAAKKQQEEADRKTARLREMDKRRAAIASKKAEQEAAEKVKQQGERRKREREDTQEKKVTRGMGKKIEEDLSKKRKVVVEIEKKSVSQDKKDVGGSRIGKPVFHAPQSQSGQSSLSKSFKQLALPASASQPTVKLVGSTQGEPKTTPAAPKPTSTKDKMHGVLDDVRQPSQTLHAQMQARVEVQLQQARLDEPMIPSESIELPDINSEYSNSDDEDRPRTFDPPGWAQSPDLRLALESQSRMNPDDIFGPVRPLRMEEIFPTRQSRFRVRTSSANWAGTDEVTRDEEAQYAKRMGYLD